MLLKPVEELDLLRAELGGLAKLQDLTALREEREDLAKLEDLATLGIDLVAEMSDSRQCWIEDPDGNVIELIAAR